LSKVRRKSASFLGKGPNGRNLCFCGCGREVVPPRLNWFSNECVANWQLVNDPATIRRLVYERDHGICALCGADCEIERRMQRETYELWMWLALREAEQLFELRKLPEPWLNSGQAWSNCYTWASRWVRKDMSARGWNIDAKHTWEADHIVPVCEGGGQCGLDNYRTLCLPCHKRVTREFAARRAAERRKCRSVGKPA
jgi:5-methylcytosine-specific restriction protein A